MATLTISLVLLAMCCVGTYSDPNDPKPKNYSKPVPPGKPIKPIVKPGHCPIPSTRCKSPFPLGKCSSDAQCPGAKKCCISVCTPMCTKPIPDKKKPGTCPPFETFAPCKKDPNPACDVDYQCPGKKKCCNYLCHVQCINPKKTRS